MIIGVTGHAQHGKDTVAEFLAPDGFQRYAFADNVRRSLWALNPYVEDEAGAIVRLQTLVAELGGTLPNNVGAGPGWDAAKRLLEVRTLLQKQGSEAVRDIVGDASWINALSKQLQDEAPRDVVITDVRFPNEVVAVKSWGGYLLRVVRLNPMDGTQHVNPDLDLFHGSERRVDGLAVDCEVRADNIDGLRIGASNFLLELKRQEAAGTAIPETPSHAVAAYINDRLDCE